MTQLDVATEDSWALKNRSSVRPTSLAGPQLSGPKLYTAQYVAERDDVGGRSRGHWSTQLEDTRVHGIENTSPRSDTIHTQPSVDNAGVSVESR